MCFKRKSDGYLLVDLTGDATPLQMNLNIGVSDLLTKKKIMLDVIAKDIPMIEDKPETEDQ